MPSTHQKMMIVQLRLKALDLDLSYISPSSSGLTKSTTTTQFVAIHKQYTQGKRTFQDRWLLLRKRTIDYLGA
jgi:hypothetical protein